MIELLLSIFILIACVSIAYLWITIDNVVHHVLYQFGLQFSYEWANSYWMFLRTSLVLLGLIAIAASINIFYFFWRKLKKPALVVKIAKKATNAEAALPILPARSMFQCTSCGRSITYPVKTNVCPFCDATVVPVSYVYSQEKARA